MSASLNNITAPDEYNRSSVLSCPGTVRVRLLISNQAIFWQRGYQNPGGGVRWGPEEEFLPPLGYSLSESCDAIRFRAAVPAAAVPSGQHQAQVTVSMRTAGELG